MTRFGGGSNPMMIDRRSVRLERIFMRCGWGGGGRTDNRYLE